nr:hypothetical protein [Micromonospora sp. DSM 115978]
SAGTLAAVAATGLTAAEVAERVADGRVNDVPVRSSRSIGEIVRANVFTRINAIVGVLFGIILVVGPIQDALFGGVIIANTLVGMIQESRAKRTLDALAVVGEARPTVRRDGVATELAAAEIVLDDLVELGSGDKIAVDGVVVEADNLEVDESLLTGEADPVHKRPGDQVMSGSFVVAGRGAFQATKVGREAYAAQLAEEASRFTLVHSQLRNGINTILRVVTWMIIPTGIALIASQLLVNDDDLDEGQRVDLEVALEGLLGGDCSGVDLPDLCQDRGQFHQDVCSGHRGRLPSGDQCASVSSLRRPHRPAPASRRLARSPRASSRHSTRNVT